MPPRVALQRRRRRPTGAPTQDHVPQHVRRLPNPNAPRHSARRIGKRRRTRGSPRNPRLRSAPTKPKQAGKAGHEAAKASGMKPRASSWSNRTPFTSQPRNTTGKTSMMHSNSRQSVRVPRPATQPQAAAPVPKPSTPPQLAKASRAAQPPPSPTRPLAKPKKASPPPLPQPVLLTDSDLVDDEDVTHVVRSTQPTSVDVEIDCFSRTEPPPES